MVDLVDRLKSLSDPRFTHGCAAILSEAAAEIESLREALLPFAKQADTHGEQIPDSMFIDDYEQPAGGAWRSLAGITVGELRRARAQIAHVNPSYQTPSTVNETQGKAGTDSE